MAGLLQKCISIVVLSWWPELSHRRLAPLLIHTWVAGHIKDFFDRAVNTNVSI